MPERFYHPQSASPILGLLHLDGDEARHLARVRRIAVGESVEVFDGRGHATQALVESTGRDKVTLRPFGDPLPGRESPHELALAVALPKGERVDWLVEKATEIGVTRLIPLDTERSTVDPRPAKLDRLRRAIVEASKQSGRNRLMNLEDPVPWSEFLRDTDPATCRYIAHPGPSLASRLPAIASGRLVVAVGPEGGFTDAEVARAFANGWTPLGLGPSLLRIETAALAACTRLLTLADLRARDSAGVRNLVIDF